jgi:GNAT superfamily N-acetyltransferase
MIPDEATSPGKDLVLRKYRSTDRHDLLELNAYGLKAAGITAEDDYYVGEDFSDLESTYSTEAGGMMLVGEISGKVVAMGGIRRVDDATCELLRMRVYPEHQGRGYGGLILRSLEQEAIRLGYHKIALITGENQHPAIDLYVRHGYRIARRETLIGIPSVHMIKEVAS